jgi:hypothetical protein
MVPMHLDLIDGPFVPHNVISTQESPVPLVKFQMAPRLKILMSSRSKKEPKYIFSFLKKIPANEPLQAPQQGPCGEIPVYRALAYILKTSQKFLQIRRP